MKKSKVVIAIALAVVLLISIISAPTFSWFSRGHSSSGASMVLTTQNAYTAYNGKNVTFTTAPSANGFSYSGTTTNYNGSGISTHGRKYFCTTITNSAGAAQNVSLYVNTLSIPTANNGTLALGVNGPTRSYRDYSALATPLSYNDRDKMRIYFEKDNNVSGWNGTEFYICWNEDTNTSSESLNSTGSNGTYTKLNWVGGSHNNQYYADIPKTATHAFFCVENWGTNNNGHENWGQRSQTLYNLGGDGQTPTASKLYKITSDTNGSGNHLVHTPPYTVTGACINHYYDNIFVAVGNTFDASLSNTNSTHIPTRTGYSANYVGSLRYYSGNTSVFTVNETTGVITPVGAGSATLYTKAVGSSYGDEQQVESTVTVTAASNYVFYDVPIVRNIQIPAGESVDVYWYVINNSETNSLSYTIDSLYLGM